VRRIGLVVALVAALSVGAVRPADAGVKSALKKTAHAFTTTLGVIAATVAVIVFCKSGACS
jgi:hypothetical protein